MWFILGATQSAIKPVIFSLLNDYFPKEKITTANSILTSGSYIGAALNTLCVFMISGYGWRNCYKYIGLFGILIGINVLIFIREP
jgi:MFS family permease